ncbi:hypothetical protein I532_24271, partial [Brevibacillus borstelensis AK1]
MFVRSSNLYWKKQLIMLLVLVVIASGFPAAFAPKVAKAEGVNSAPGGVETGLISWVDVENSMEDKGKVAEISSKTMNDLRGNRLWKGTGKYLASALNFNAGIEVPKTGLFTTSASSFNQADSEREVFSVQANNGIENNRFPWEFGTGQAGKIFSSYGPDKIITMFGRNALVETEAGIDLKNATMMNIWSASNDWRLSLNGVQKSSLVSNDPKFTANTSGANYYIGAGHESVFDGKISEVILYNRKLELVERQKVNSYLALKYGLTLKDENGNPTNYIASDSTDGTDGTKMWTANKNVGYGNRITGIGLDKAGNLNQKQSKSQEPGANVTIALGENIELSNTANNNMITNDKSFFTFSDNDQSTEYTTVVANDKLPNALKYANPTTVSAKMMSRVYKVDKTAWGDKTVTLQVDGAQENGPTFYLYINDNDPDFAADTTKVFAADKATGKVTLDSSNFADGSYFTFVMYVDKKALEAQVIRDEQLKQENYNAGWEAFQQALAAAKSVLEDANKTEKEVNDALANLNSARGALVQKIAPGGLTDGLALWLRPDAGINVASGEPVSSWEDQSGQDNHASQSAQTTQPIYWNEPDHNVNFNPMLRFDGNDFLVLDDKKLPLRKEPRTIVSVAATEVTSGNHYIISWGTANWYQMMGMLQINTTGSLTAYSNEFTSDKGFWTVGVPNELFGTYDGSTGALYSRMNQIGKAARNWDTIPNSANIGKIIGRNDEYWKGTIGDLIVYDRVLNDTERQRISTYLSLKYGYTLENTDYLDTNGETVWDATENSNYNHNIAGIAIDTKGALLQKQSHSTNVGDQVIIGLDQIVEKNSDNPASFDSDNQYLIWGDNGKALLFDQQIGDTKEYRAQRVWKVQNTGGVGKVEIAIPVTDIPAGKKLLVSSDDTDFTSATGYELQIKDINGVAHYAATVPEGLTDGQFFTYGVLAPEPENVTLEEATVGGNEITITFDQEINPQNVTKDGFAVLVGDGTQGVIIDSITVDGKTVKLKLSQELLPNDAVKLEYKKAEGNLKGTNGASVLDFSKEVSNNLIALPTVSIEQPAGDKVFNSKPEFSGTATPGAKVTVKVAEGITLTATADENGNWSVKPTTDIPDGDYSVAVTAEKDGKVSEPVTKTIKVDTAELTVEMTSPTGTVNTGKPVFSGTATPGAKITVKVSEDITLTATADENGNWSVTPT